jgi:hypothetical protein
VASARHREPVPLPASYRVDGVALGREMKWMRLREEIRKRRKKEKKGKEEKMGKRKREIKKEIFYLFLEIAIHKFYFAYYYYYIIKIEYNRYIN